MQRRSLLLGVSIDILPRAEVFERCRGWLRGDRLRHVVTANPELVLAARDPAVRDVFAGADLVVPDGVGIVWASRRAGGAPPERVTGVDLVRGLTAVAAPPRPQGLPPRNPWGRTAVATAHRIAFVGGRCGAAAAAAAALAAQHPGLTVLAAGDALPLDHPSVWEVLERERPALLFAAYGSPAQEVWIATYRARLEAAGVRLAVGVGGAFDMLAGLLPRAPRWVQALGLEWLWRLLLEPWRLLRVWRAVVVFPVRVLLARDVFARRE